MKNNYKLEEQELLNRMYNLFIEGCFWACMETMNINIDPKILENCPMIEIGNEKDPVLSQQESRGLLS